MAVREKEKIVIYLYI